MKVSRIKKDYKGLVITRNHMLVGNITFDAAKVQPEQYDNFKKIGFEDVFEEVEVCDVCKTEDCTCKKAESNSSPKQNSLEQAEEQVKEYSKKRTKKK